MSNLITCRLSRIDSSPWGFRLQGGKDFGTPLIVQKVHGNSLAEKSGVMAGDAVIRVNGTDVYNLKHKEAQNVIIKAGNSFEMIVSRGGLTWKPQVTVVNNKAANGGLSTKTSLEYCHNHHNNDETIDSDSRFNSSAKPFSPVNQMNGGTIDRKKLMSKQYNSPVPLYSDKTIAETLSAQAEVLETGALGVNFKKNERNYDSSNSEVYKMVQEEYQYPDKELLDDSSRNSSHHFNNSLDNCHVPGVRSVSAPETKFIPTSTIPTHRDNNVNTQLPPGQNICAECERLIVGVFVRIKDKNLHVECFKCATCGSSLKNVGYYNIHNKLYCDVHAKMIARNNPPAPNLIPITISPYDKPTNTMESSKNTIRCTQSPAPMSPSSTYSSSSYQQSKYSSSTLPRTNAHVHANTNNTAKPNIVSNNITGSNMNACYPNQNTSSVTKSFSSLQKTSTVSSRTSEANSEDYSTDNTSSNNNNSIVSKSECPLLKSELEELALRYQRNLKLDSSFSNKPKDDEFINSIIEEIRSIDTNCANSPVAKVIANYRQSPLLPAYQENIVAVEKGAVNSTNFDPRSRSTTPSNLSSCGRKSPAVGPPPKPVIVLKPRDSKFVNFTDSPMLVSDNIAMKHTALLQQLNSDFFDTKLFNSCNYESAGLAKSLSNVVTKTQSPRTGTNTGTTSFNNKSCSTTGRQCGAIGTAPKRGRGIFNANIGPGARTPQCAHCRSFIRGPFITALGKIWCPEHFTCTTPSCKRPLQDLGFVEENGELYCEFCFEQYLAPACHKCRSKIKGECLKAIGKHFHPECFTCTHCSRKFGNSPFFLEDNLPYCENDWNELFTTKCFACGFPVEAGDRWVEALGNNYHSQCFNCTMCKTNLEGQSFFAKSGRPYCKQHSH